MTRTRSLGRLVALTAAVVLFVPLVWILLLAPVLGALGVPAEVMGSIGWLVALAVTVGVGYVLYRDLPASRGVIDEDTSRDAGRENE